MRGRSARLLVGAIAMAIVMVVAVPAALAAYTGTYVPTLSVTPHTLFVPTTFACTPGISATVTLTWSSSGSATADPYGGFASDGYQIEVTTDSGLNWTTLSARPTRTSTTAQDSPSVGSLAVGAPVSYRIRSTRSNWVSVASTSVTVHVIVVSVVKVVSC